MAVDLAMLNDPQKEAVLHTEGPLLVLAGAGSGKTRVLTYRIAHLVEDLGVAPWEILAITFTNKAANEMRDRLRTIIGHKARGMWVSTFHSMCVRILRTEADRVGFTSNFTIYDSDDLKRLYRDIMTELRIDRESNPLNYLMNRISALKNELIFPDEFDTMSHNYKDDVVASVYDQLQERLHAANAFDFDDLLLYAWLLLKDNPDVLASYQQRFHYIMVDEYQDTNHAQYEITRLLAAAHKNIMVVGDDDQSIYSWRGADIQNILEFESDYPNAHTVKLEQNYRSVGNILKAANAIIANNVKRKTKRLFTASEAGDLVNVYMAIDEHDEGRWIAGEIERRHDLGQSYNDMAVFYRTNAQSRVLEDMLLRAGVPYRIVGGTRFFDRAEIRDVMAYLTLAVNPADDISAKRVINTPRRGIGKTTIARLEEKAAALDLTFMEAVEESIVDETLRPSVRKALAQFLAIIKTAQTYEGDLRKIVEMIINKSGIIDAYVRENTEVAEGRIENIRELLSVVKDFQTSHTPDDAFFVAPTVTEPIDPLKSLEIDELPEGVSATEEVPLREFSGESLEDFVEWVRLRTDLDTLSENGHAVTLMTVHSAKGLEFDVVFVAGMEETLFPHQSFDDPHERNIEEERRLAYVAITRARKNLYLTSALQRQLYGQTNVNQISRFVIEIPEELRKISGVGSAGFMGLGWEKRGSRRGIAGSGHEAGGGRVFGRSSTSQRAKHTEHAAPSRKGAQEKTTFTEIGVVAPRKKHDVTFAKGDHVDHKTFGRGVVVKVDKDTISVKFDKYPKTKQLLVAFAPIVKISA